MIEEVMRYCRNFFPEKSISGTFVIEGGDFTKDLPFMAGQYILIEGSVFNDGVHRYGMEGYADETFSGVLTGLKPPNAFLSMVDEINDYSSKYEATTSPYTSESFGGYSYTKATNSKGESVTWKDAFRGRLNEWRKI